MGFHLANYINVCLFPMHCKLIITNIAFITQCYNEVLVY